ncbi:unnamed protein product [Rotaria sordida]|uniref:Uncharacterized protein n=1 Tax=Rotaria sordida TaxID=392033 RepID=A0A814ZYW9_9BILA|nr:unnamed protein product [Rotaria sordida]
MNIDGTNNSAVGTTSNSLLLQKFLNGDADLRSIEQRDLRRLLSELETKYKTAMIANSSMYNEKQALRYQVDTFKDILDEHYETLTQAKRQLKEKTKYCRQSITIRAGSNRLVALKEPNFPQNAYPPVKRIYRFSRKKWNELINLINDKSFQSLNDTEGCPDCADGGAEWIEIQWTNQKKRVTFENGKLIKGFEGLVVALRNIRVNTTQNL